MATVGPWRITLDGEWSLFEFSGFGRQYVQSYSLLYALSFPPEATPSNGIFAEEVWNDPRRYAFLIFPWKGGWSAVDFYDTLRAGVPADVRPRIREIRYASPGFIELEAAVEVTWQLAKCVGAIALSLTAIHRVYNGIYTGMKNRRLLSIKVARTEMEFSREKLAFAEESVRTLGKEIDLQEENVQALLNAAPNSIVALKILMSLYRRLETLAKMQETGKIKF